jgi:hypothetical protein
MHGRCERGTGCGVRAVRACGGDSSCTKEMRYGLHVTSNDRAPASDTPSLPAAPRSGASAGYKPRVFGASGRPRLTCPCKLLRLSRLAITQYYVRHMEWGFYSEKPATGGAGVRPGYTTATATHSPPQIFFRQLAPFAVDATRRHATFPYVRQDISQPCAAAGLARYVVVSVAGFLLALRL